MGLERLGASLRETQDRQLERIDVSSTPSRLLSPARPRRRAPLVLAAAAVALATALVVLWPRSLDLSVDGAAVHAGQWIAAPADAGVTLDFSDGSRFELAPGARVRVGAVDAKGARIVVEQGAVDAAVTHRPGARWSLQLGPYEVGVIGTRFVAGWKPESESLSVVLHEGAVRVTGPGLGDGLTMSPGQRIEITAPRNEVTVRTEDPPATREEARPAPAREEARPEPEPDPEAPAIEGWRALAAEARYDEALAAAHAIGFDALCERLDAPSLLSLADVARFAGDDGAARRALEAARRRFAGDASARAAFLLGRLVFDADPGAAAGYFSAYLAEAPSGPLAREAQGRLVESLHAAGRLEEAASAAAVYLARHPKGPHAPLARRVREEASDPYR